MGSFLFSMNFKTDDAKALHATAKKVLQGSGGHLYIAPPAKGWISAYPSDEVMEPDIARNIAAKTKIEHALVLGLMDSDVMEYWYYRHGKLADSFNSCPDYFGKAKKKDLSAVGDAQTFTGLLSKADCTKLAKLVGRRMVNGEYVGRGADFDFEDERFEKIAALLKIPGASGWYDDIVSGQLPPGVATIKAMTTVGKPARKSTTAARSAHPPQVVRDGKTVKVGEITFTLSTTPLMLDSSGNLAPARPSASPRILRSTDTPAVQPAKRGARPQKKPSK